MKLVFLKSFQHLDEAMKRRLETRIEMPIPSVEQKKLLIRKILSNFNHSLNDQDFEKLAQSMKRFSHHDVMQLEKELHQKRWKILQSAEYFIKATEGTAEPKYEVCSKNHQDAIPMTFHDIKYSDLIPMRVEKSQVEQIVVMLKSSVSQDCIDMITAWKNGRMR